MKRWRVYLLGSIAPLFTLPAHADDLVINAKTTTAASSSSAANGSAGNITISSTGSVEIPSTATAGAAVTLDSSNTLINNGTISNAFASGSEGVNIIAGNTGSFTNAGTISVPGVLTAGIPTSATQYGVLLSGTGSFTGNIVTTPSSTITISAAGLPSADIALQSALVGNLNLAGSIKASGSAVTGVSVSGAITGAFTNTGTIATDSGDTRTTTIHASPGSTVAIGASVSGGILNAGGATISTIGAGPALLIAPSAGGGLADLALGAYNDTNNPGYSVLNRGFITADGTQPGVAAVGVHIGDGGNSTYVTTLAGGLYNSGTIRATATSDNSTATTVAAAQSDATAFIVDSKTTIPNIRNDGTISATTGGPMGGTAIAFSIQSGASFPTLVNTGTISASANTTVTSIASLAATAIVDASGTLTNITNSGTISATATTLDSLVQTAVAADLSTSVGPVTFLDSGRVVGDLKFGIAQANQLTIEGPQANVTGKIQATSEGTVNIAVSTGGTGGTLATTGTQAGTVTVGPGGNVVLELTQNTNTIVSASGPISFDAASHVTLLPVAMLTSNGTYTLVHSNASLTFANLAATTANATLPFLFTGQMSLDAESLTLQVTRRSASELGLTGTSAEIYEPAMAASLKDPLIGAALASLSSAQQVSSALQAFYPIASSAPRDSALAISNSVTNSVGARQYAFGTASGDTNSGAWAEILNTELKNTSGTGYDISGTGFAAGFDAGLGGIGHAGVAFTYSHGTPQGPRDRQVTTEWSMGSIYTGLAADGAFVNAQIDFGFGNFQGTRNFAVGSVSRTVSTQDWSAFMNAMDFSGGYVVDLNVLRVIPQVNMDMMTLSKGRYAENGGGEAVDLNVSDRFETYGRIFVGLGIDQDFKIGAVDLIPNVRAGWSHDLDSTADDTEAAFQNDPITTFTVPGVPLDASDVIVDAKFAVAMRNFRATVGYDQTIGSRMRSHSAKISLQTQF